MLGATRDDLHQMSCILCLLLTGEHVLSYTLGANDTLSSSRATWLLIQADGAQSKPSLREGDCDWEGAAILEDAIFDQV